MDFKALESIWTEIEERKSCDSCPLKDPLERKGIKPLIFKPKRDVKVMVITYGPNRIRSPEIIASLANHPTYTYLSALFGGRFVPMGENATAYWTHLRKCFIKDENGNSFLKNDKDIMSRCAKRYLIKEIEAVQPKLILAVGERVMDFFMESDRKESERMKIIAKEDIMKKLKRKNFTDVFFSQWNEKKGRVEAFKIELKDATMKVNMVIVPHPSGRSLFFVDPIQKGKGTKDDYKMEKNDHSLKKILENIQEMILELLP